MNIEPKELEQQCAQISCLVDDLNKLTRKLSVSAQSASQAGKDVSLAYAFNMLTVRRLTKTIDMFSLILETLGSQVAQSTLSDNLLVLQQQSHLSPCEPAPQGV